MVKAWAAVAAVVAAGLLSAGSGAVAVAAEPAGAATAALAGDYVVMAAGDIACPPGSARGRKCRDDLTAAKLDAATHVVTLGDNQYLCGELSSFMGAYDKTWGRHLTKTYPTVGEDEYSSGTCQTPGAAGYFTYFKDRAQQTDCPELKACKGWYSYDVGADWHVVTLNTACAEPGVGGCSASSAQVKWLKEDLARNNNAIDSKRCVMAVMHRPYWSNGKLVNKFKPIVDALYAGGTDVLLTGNSHLYARYAQQNPSSQVDAAKGMRAFIVGTGGRSHSTLASTPLKNLQASNDTTFGVLQLTLQATSYDWNYLQAYPETTRPYTDAGTTSCH
jgi:hypothetical protein